MAASLKEFDQFVQYSTLNHQSALYFPSLVFLQHQIREKDEKLRRVKQALKEDLGYLAGTASSTSTNATNVTSKSDGSTSQFTSGLPKTPGPESRRVGLLFPGFSFVECNACFLCMSHSFLQMGMALRNPRHRRSRSAEGTGRWLDHCPATPVPLNTVFQPSMKKRKSITKLTDVKDITKGTERYCLTTQEQDTDGELETRLYKVCILCFICVAFYFLLDKVSNVNILLNLGGCATDM